MGNMVNPGKHAICNVQHKSFKFINQMLNRLMLKKILNFQVRFNVPTWVSHLPKVQGSQGTAPNQFAKVVEVWDHVLQPEMMLTTVVNF